MTTGAAMERAAKAAVKKTDFIFATDCWDDDPMYRVLVNCTGECDVELDQQ